MLYCKASAGPCASQTCLGLGLRAEFDALNRLGIPDPVGYIKKRFRGRKLLFLQASCVDQTIIQQMEASVEEAVSSGTWIDVQVCL